MAEVDGLFETQYEQQKALEWEEKDWVKTVWKEDDKKAVTETPTPASEVRETIWAKPVVTDSRIATRMRRFELQPEDEARARAIVVPEEEVEGWIKNNLRHLFRWGASQFSRKEKPVVLVDDE